MLSVYDVIRRVIMSEKSTILTELGRKYVFEVAIKANKHQVKDAVQKIYSVGVSSVSTLVMHGKVKKTSYGYSQPKNWKKAVVTLKEGHKIDLTQA